jgi:hypothetical protein
MKSGLTKDFWKTAKSDSTVKHGRSKLESFVIHNTVDDEVDWMRGSTIGGKKGTHGMRRIRGNRTTTGRSIDMFNLSVEETESMKEKNSPCETLEGEEFLKVKKELLVANNKKMMEKMLEMRK